VQSYRLEAIFSGIRALNVAVIGDFALDMYYNECGPIGENSVETGRPVFGATAPHTAPGAAGNPFASVAMGPKC
jgi:bifunctional ADP-heptose synthase (sugar kinase/adenylyltransferase)